MKARPHSSAGRLRALLADVLELMQVRLELLGVEARQDAGQLLAIAIQGLLAAMLGTVGLLFLALLLTVLLWESQRVLVLAVAAGLFLGAALVLGLLAWRRLRRGLRLFSASVTELRRDQEALRE